MSRRISLIRIGLLALYAAALIPGTGDDAGPGYVLQEFRAENAFVVRPGEMRELRTRIQRTDGSGVPGVAVLFAAPTEGPSGTFAGATGPSGSFIRVESDASGIASVMITTNDVEGVFEVGVRVEGLAAFNQFSFTNTSELPATAAEPQAVREEVYERILDNAPLGTDLQMHGPVFLRAGSIVTAPARPDPVRPDYPIRLERDSWLMWIDEAPTGLFAHEAQWILMDASHGAQQAAAEARAYRVRWYPVVVQPGEATGWALHYPAGSHPEAFNPDLFPEPDPFPAAVRVAQSDPGNACLIAVRGPGLRGAHNDVHNYVRTHVSLGQVSPDRVFTNGPGGSVRQGASPSEIGVTPVSTADIQRLVARAVTEKCTKVFFLMSSHGLDVNHGGGVVTTDRGASNPLPFEDYANILAGLKEAGDNVEMCLFQSSCYAGQISQWLWGLGLPGSVVTPADENHMAWEDPRGRGSIYLSLFLQAKRSPQIADADNDGKVSDDEAKRVIEQRVQPSTQTFGTGDKVERIFDPGPSVTTISGSPSVEGRWAGGEDVYMTGPGSRASICIRRPRSMPRDAEFTGKVTINNADVAANRAFDPTVEGQDGVKASEIEFTMAPGSKQVKLALTATGCGVSRFRFFGKAKDRDGTEVDYSGTAMLQVGHFIVLDPDAPAPRSLIGPPVDNPVTSVTIQQGSSKRLKIKFIGRDFDSTAPATTAQLAASRAATVSITPRDDSITTPTPATVMKAPLEKEAEFTLSGDKVGKTKVILAISNRYSNLRDRPGGKELEVIVVAPPEKKVSLLDPCGESTTEVAVGVASSRDPENHEGAVGAMPAAFNAEIMLDRGNMYIRSGPRLLADMSGSVDCTTGEFEVSGDTGTRISGYPRAPGRAVGRFPMAPAAVTEEGKAQAVEPIVISYEVGRGVFPGLPIEYDLEAVPLAGGSGDCEYDLSLTTDRFAFAGGETTAVVATDLGCQWTAVSDAPDWLGLQGSAERIEGTGPGSFRLRAIRNPANAERVATVTVQGQEATVSQAGTREAGPVIDSVVNGASFSSGVAARSWLTVGGWNLADTTRIWGDVDFNDGALPTSLDGVSVTINGAPAYVFFISPGQLNVLSDEAIDGSQAVDVVVSNTQGTSAAYRTTGLPVDPALFLFDPFNRQYAAAVHADGTFVGRTDLFQGLSLRPAKSGDVVLFFGAGFGATTPMQPSSRLVATPAALARPVTVRIGGLVADVLFAGRVSSGLYQLNVVVPEGLAPGDHLVEMFIEETPIQPGVLLTVE